MTLPTLKRSPTFPSPQKSECKRDSFVGGSLLGDGCLPRCPTLSHSTPPHCSGNGDQSGDGSGGNMTFSLLPSFLHFLSHESEFTAWALWKCGTQDSGIFPHCSQFSKNNVILAERDKCLCGKKAFHPLVLRGPCVQMLPMQNRSYHHCTSTVIYKLTQSRNCWGIDFSCNKGLRYMMACGSHEEKLCWLPAALTYDIVDFPPLYMGCARICTLISPGDIQHPTYYATRHAGFSLDYYCLAVHHCNHSQSSICQRLLKAESFVWENEKYTADGECYLNRSQMMNYLHK